MAELGYKFDATQVEPSAPREIVPAGEYVVQIVKSEMVPTKNNDGQMLVLEEEIVDGPFTGRRLWDRLNLDNPSQQAVEIAQRTLSAICRATGVMAVSDSEQLHFKPMVAVVKVLLPGVDKKGYERKEPQNEISGYKPANDAPAQHVTQQRAPSAPQGRATTPQGPARSAPSTNTAPWLRRG